MNNQANLTSGPFGRLYELILQYAPNLLQATFIFALGLGLGLALRLALAWLLGKTRLDALSERTGTTDLLKRAGVKCTFSGLLARIAGGLVVVVFASASILALEIPATEQFLEKFILYLPNVFAAGLILLAGYILGNFLGRAILIAAVNANLRLCGSLGKGVRAAVVLLAATMALEQLGIGGETLVIAFGVVLGGIVLSLALAFGLGARDIARRYLEEKMEGIPEPDRVSHI